MPRCVLPPPDERRLSRQETAGILARLGLESCYDAGPHSVYVGSQADGKRVVFHFSHRWDRRLAELMQDLAKNGFSRVEVEAAFESLYSDH